MSVHSRFIVEDGSILQVATTRGGSSDLSTKDLLTCVGCRGQLKYDGTRAEIRFRLSAKRTNPFKSAGGLSSVDYWQPSCAHQR